MSARLCLLLLVVVVPVVLLVVVANNAKLELLTVTGATSHRTRAGMLFVSVSTNDDNGNGNGNDNGNDKLDHSIEWSCRGLMRTDEHYTRSCCDRRSRLIPTLTDTP